MDFRPGRSAWRGLAWLVGALALAGAAILGAIFVVFFTAAVVVISLMAVVVLALAGAAVRARRSVRRQRDPNLIEARNIGGHSWVAYGWDGRR
jgi:hypothetical protein